MLAVIGLVVVGIAAAMALGAWRDRRAAQTSLDARIAAIQPAPASVQESACSDWRAENPVVLLALGQSNAANHGEAGPPFPPVRVVHGGRCFWTTDPLPGGTGDGASIWARLPQRLAAQLPVRWRTRPVVLAVLAVDATPLRDWVRPDSRLLALLQRTAQDLQAVGLVPSLVLWQQGEADARADTASVEMAAQLEAFAGVLAQAGITAPWMLAMSTICRSAPHTGVRAAVARLATQPALSSPQRPASSDGDGPRFLSGPDTDRLASTAMRRDGCHFSTTGLDAAADLWTAALAAYFAGR